MHFVIAGASGFLGTRLRERLTRDDHSVTALTRADPGPKQVRWDPYAGNLTGEAREVVQAADVVVNLAGSPLIGMPYSSSYRTELRRSRVTTTEVLAEAIATAADKPAFLAGNGISWYGDRGEELLTEAANPPPSTDGDLLASVSQDWQAAADAAVEAGARVCFLRTAPVLDRRSEPLHALSLLFKTGLGGPIGSGRQYFPTISARDWTGAVAFAAEHDEISGPVNLTIPTPATNAEFTRELASRVHRPAFLKVPGPVVKAATGPLAPMVLGSVRALPTALAEAGFGFADPTIGDVLDAGLRA